MEKIYPAADDPDQRPIMVPAIQKAGIDAGTAAIRELPEKAKARLFDLAKALSRMFALEDGVVSKSKFENELKTGGPWDRYYNRLEDIVGNNAANQLGLYLIWWAIRYTELVFFNASDCDEEVGDARKKANNYFKGKIYNLARSDVKALVQDFTMRLVRDNGHEVAIALFKKARDGDSRSMEHFIKVFYPELAKPEVNMVGVSVGFDPTKMPTNELQAQVLQLRKSVGETQEDESDDE